MQYVINDTGPAVIVCLDGQVNYASSSDFKSLMEDLSPYFGRKVVFDLEHIRQIDSVGLGFLYVAKAELERPGQPMGLRAPQEAVVRLLQLTESLEDFDIQP